MFLYLSKCHPETETILVFWTRNVEYEDLATCSREYKKKDEREVQIMQLGWRREPQEGINLEGGSPSQGWVSELSGELMNMPLDKNEAGPKWREWGTRNLGLRLATQLAGGWVPLVAHDSCTVGERH